MDDVKMKLLERADGKITELHAYMRVNVQLIVTWYTFFQTFQFASMGWLAASGPANERNLMMIVASLFFISQNVSSYFTCLAMLREIEETKRKLDFYEDYVAGLQVGGDVPTPADKCLPLDFYRAGLKLMRFSFIPSGTVWLLFLVHLMFR
jgi:hypothetical protein